MIQYPGDSAATLGGMLLAGVSAGGEGLGVALDATGVGAIAGVPSTSCPPPGSPRVSVRPAPGPWT